MTWPVGGLGGRIEVARVKIVRELREYEFFCDFGEKGEVADGAVILECVWVE